MIEARIEADELHIKLEKVTPQIKSRLKAIIRTGSQEIQSHIRSKYFTSYAYGKKSEKIQTRTSFLTKSIQPIKIKDTGGAIEGGVDFGASYASTHVGPKESSITIKPKTKKFLTIPLEAAMTKRGELRGSALDKSVWGETFIEKNDKGDLIIYGKRVMQKGKRAGKTAGDIVPLFLLRKKVTIKRRIHPEEIVVWGKEKVTEAIKENLLK